MRIAGFLVLTLSAVFTARADFSYTTTRKSAQGPQSGAAPQTTRHYLKGQKMKMDSGDTATIMDFDAQTVTTIHNTLKTYSVTRFSDMGQALDKAGVDAKMDAKETGQHKAINGFDASEIVMTIAVDGPQAGLPGTKMTMEMEIWVSSAVPGAPEYRAFYQKNANRFPWAALGGGGNPGIQKAMAEVQKKMATSGGVPVLQVVKMKTSGSEAQMAQVEASRAQARVRLEEMKKKGGQQAIIADQLIARMGAMGGGGGMGSLFETTMESSDFSTGSIPDSVFAIPAGYQKAEKK
jgi:hypothetical protein